jgi:hypothetical protein
VKFSKKSLETIMISQSPVDAKVMEAIESYHKQKEMLVDVIDNYDPIDTLYSWLKIPSILTPLQIAELCSLVQEYPGVFFLNKVIQESYNSGNNHFIINTGDFVPNNLLSTLRGTSTAPLVVDIIGNAGIQTGFHGEDLIVSINGNNGNLLGAEGKNLQMTVTESNGNNAMRLSINSTLTVLGSNGALLGEHSKYLRAEIYGNNGTFESRYHPRNYNSMEYAAITLHGLNEDRVCIFADNNTFFVKLPETYAKLKATGADVRMIE